MRAGCRGGGPEGREGERAKGRGREEGDAREGRKKNERGANRRRRNRPFHLYAARIQLTLHLLSSLLPRRPPPHSSFSFSHPARGAEVCLVAALFSFTLPPSRPSHLFTLLALYRVFLCRDVRPTCHRVFGIFKFFNFEITRRVLSRCTSAYRWRQARASDSGDFDDRNLAAR